MKLTEEDKLTIYLLHTKGCGITRLSKMFNVNIGRIKYICYLADRHGIDILCRRRAYYSYETRLQAIKRVLENKESLYSVSVDLGLSDPHLLKCWINSYIKNGYNVVTNTKGGNPAHAQKKEDNRRTGERKQISSGTIIEAYYRERILKKTVCLNYRGKKEEKEQLAGAVTELRQELKCSLDLILDTINTNDSLPHLTRSDYYFWKNRVDPDNKHTDLMAAITRVFNDNHKRYGYRRITLQLNNEGWKVNHKTVKRLMSKMNLYGVTPRAKYRSYKGDFNRTTDNKLLDKQLNKRDFSTTDVNEKWTTDISEFHIAAGKLYLSPILDMHNREIVAYNISKNPNYLQIADMLNKAFNEHKDLTHLILHSDQGWQYQMKLYHEALEERGITQSMSRKGNCLDNSPMENFFGKMKNEMFYGHEYEFETLEQLQKAMEEYIDYYNNARIQVKLNGLTPCQVRAQSLY